MLQDLYFGCIHHEAADLVYHLHETSVQVVWLSVNSGSWLILQSVVNHCRPVMQHGSLNDAMLHFVYVTVRLQHLE